MELFQRKGFVIEGTTYNAMWSNRELPVLHAWVLDDPLGEGGQVTFNRNPFYWKMDPEGRQLPYIDRVVFEVVRNESVIVLKATNGELDMHMRHINTVRNKPVLARNRSKGGYRFFDATPRLMNVMLLVPNLTHEDPVKREIFNNRDFRIGLSHAINREELSDAVYQRQGEPWQCAPGPESEYYDEEMAKQFTSYDVDTASEYLDRAGYSERDDAGWRLGPDGQPITVRIEYATGFKPSWPDAAGLVQGYWRAVGIDVKIGASGFCVGPECVMGWSTA